MDIIFGSMIKATELGYVGSVMDISFGYVSSAMNIGHRCVNSQLDINFGCYGHVWILALDINLWNGVV